jgi:hypothetical protein
VVVVLKSKSAAVVTLGMAENAIACIHDGAR